jgi:hypothetical protein
LDSGLSIKVYVGISHLEATFQATVISKSRRVTNCRATSSEDWVRWITMAEEKTDV